MKDNITIVRKPVPEDAENPCTGCCFNEFGCLDVLHLLGLQNCNVTHHYEIVKPGVTINQFVNVGIPKKENIR